jgi:hypothetical protein
MAIHCLNWPRCLQAVSTERQDDWGIIKVEVKQSLYWSGEAPRIPGVSGSQNFKIIDI